MLRKLSVLLLLLVANTVWSQTPETRILFLLDGSGSMYAKMGVDNRITVAKRLLTRLVDSLESNKDIQLALRVYGHQSPKTDRNCEDTKLEVPFENYNHGLIKHRIQGLRPKGTTLIAYSLQEAAYDFPKTPGVRNIIILITDGIEECDGDPCAVSTALQKQGVILRPFIIGLGLDNNFREQFECVGRYFEAETEDDFKDVLNVVISQAVNNTSAQVNLLNAFGKPTETDVNMTFTDAKTGKVIYNLVHTINYRGNPDTIYIDPTYTYNLKVHTIPPVIKENITLTAGEHNTIALDAGQGSLALQIDGVTNYKDLKAVVYRHGSSEIVNVQDFNDKQQYLVGEYDLEILTLPRIRQDNVGVVQNKTTTLQVQQPGKLNIVTRKNLEIAIYRNYKGKTEMVKRLNLQGNQTVTVLQPGTYELIFRESAIKETLKTKERTFHIKSGEITHININ